MNPFCSGIPGSDPKTWKSSSLAHELSISLRGQYSFGDRLIAQKQMTGWRFLFCAWLPKNPKLSAMTLSSGLSSTDSTCHEALKPLSVRSAEKNQEKSPTYLDSKLRLGKKEYEKRTPFNVIPDRVFSRPDWDLVIRAFYDFAVTQTRGGQDVTATESDQDLRSIGVGLETQFSQVLQFTRRLGLCH